jgi:hypothetical protein
MRKNAPPNGPPPSWSLSLKRMSLVTSPLALALLLPLHLPPSNFKLQ